MKPEKLTKLQEASKNRYWKGGKVVRMPVKPRKPREVKQKKEVQETAKIEPQINYEKVMDWAKRR